MEFIKITVIFVKIKKTAKIKLMTRRNVFYLE